MMDGKALVVVLLLVVGLAVAAWLGYNALLGPPVITIVNASGRPVTELTIAAQGWSTRIDALGLGESTHVIARIRGESGLEIEFTADAERYRSAGLAYIETDGGYCVVLTINPDLGVDVEAHLGCVAPERLLG